MVEIVQPPNAKRSENHDQQKEDQKHAGEMNSDGVRLPHEKPSVRGIGT
jgi:hypothetical protein